MQARTKKEIKSENFMKYNQITLRVNFKNNYLQKINLLIRFDSNKKYNILKLKFIK